MTKATARGPRSSTRLIAGLSVAVLALSLGACTRSLVGVAPTKAAGSSGQSSATGAGSKTAGPGGAAAGSTAAGARSGPGSTGGTDPTVKATNDSGAEVTALSADGKSAAGTDGSGAAGGAGGRSSAGAGAAGTGGGAGGANAAGAAGGAKGATGSTGAGAGAAAAGGAAAGSSNKGGAGATAAGSSAAGAGGATAGGAAGRKGAGGGDTDVAAAKGAGGTGAGGAGGAGAAGAGGAAAAAGAGGGVQESAAEAEARAQREREEALEAERRGRVETAANRVVIDQDEKLQTLGGTLPATFNMDEQGQFEFDKYELNNEVKAKLDEIWDKLKDAPYDRLIVHGYTDRIGTEEYNQQLSEKRAWAVAGYLMDKGVPPYKLTVVGRGKAAPLTTPDECKGLKRDALIDCLQRDRRVEVVATLKEYNLKVQ